MHVILGALAIVGLCVLAGGIATGVAYLIARGIAALIPNKREEKP